MKKNKVKLMRQLKEDTAKNKKLELKKQQEIIKLQREKQKQVMRKEECARSVTMYCSMFLADASLRIY